MIYALGPPPNASTSGQMGRKRLQFARRERERDSSCVQREFAREISRFLPWRQDVRRSRRDVETGPGDGFEAGCCFWSPLGSCGTTHWSTDRRLWVGDAMWAVVYVVGQEVGFRWVFEPRPEMIQGVMRLGRPWVASCCVGS